MAAFEAGLAAITAAASAATSGAISASNAALANKRQYKNWLKQHSVQLADWRMQNEYNSPVNARQRLVDAGINPNLIAGDSGNAGAISSPGQIPFERPDFSGLQEMYNNAARLYFQGEENRRANELVTQQISESKAREENYNELASLNAAKTAWEILRESGYRTNDLFGRMGRRMEAQIGLFIAQKSIADLNADFLRKTMNTRIAFETAKLELERAMRRYSDAGTSERYAHSRVLGAQEQNILLSNILNGFALPYDLQNRMDKPFMNLYSNYSKYWQGRYYNERSRYTGLQSDYYPYMFGLKAFQTFSNHQQGQMSNLLKALPILLK